MKALVFGSRQALVPLVQEIVESGMQPEIGILSRHYRSETQEWFGRDAFKENPIGVLFDPEELLKAFEAGVPEEELLTRPRGNAAPSLAARG